jgi:hypothetical protein
LPRADAVGAGFSSQTKSGDLSAAADAMIIP